MLKHILTAAVLGVGVVACGSSSPADSITDVSGFTCTLLPNDTRTPGARSYQIEAVITNHGDDLAHYRLNYRVSDGGVVTGSGSAWVTYGSGPLGPGESLRYSEVHALTDGVDLVRSTHSCELRSVDRS